MDHYERLGLDSSVDFGATLPQIRDYEIGQGVGISLGAWIEAKMGVRPIDICFGGEQPGILSHGLAKTRDADRFYLMLNHIAQNGRLLI